MEALNLEAWQIEEITRCLQSPEYFIENFCWLQQKASAGVSEKTSIIPFEMGENENEPHFFQRQIIRWLHERENVCTLKSRRVGCSWIAAAYAAWLINFHENVSIYFISRNGASAKQILAKVRFILKNLAYHDNPEIRHATKAPWLRGHIHIENQERIAIGWHNDQGEVAVLSEVISLNNTDDSARGEDATFIIFDELAFYEHPDETWASAITTLARGGHWMAISTPQGISNIFHRLCARAELAEDGKLEDKLDYKFIKIHWSQAGITAEQVRKSTTGLTDELALQEWEFHFIAPGTVVFHPTHLAACYKPLREYPQLAHELDLYRELTFAQDAKGNYANIMTYYYSGVDSAVGKAHKKSKDKDWNAFTAFTKSRIQAFAHYDQKPLSEWAGQTIDDGKGGKFEVRGKVSQFHEEYPGLCQIEENGPGYTVINRHQMGSDPRSRMFMVNTNAKMKKGLIERLMIAVESHSIVITDPFTYQQMSVFQRGSQPGQYEAPEGWNDDLVIAVALANDGIDQEGGMEFAFGTTVESLQRAPDKQEVDYEKLIGSGPKLNLQIPDSARRAVDMTGLPEGPGYLPNPISQAEYDKISKFL